LANHLVDTILSKGNRQAHNLKVAGSNPAPPPNLKPPETFGGFLFQGIYDGPAPRLRL
jgi:hypothetical protein